MMGPPDRFEHKSNYYFGLIKCVILPPQNLFHPFLPFRVPSKGNSMKLVFHLCNTCAVNRQREKCRHNERESALDGTWQSPEKYKALELGYKLLKIIAAWDFEEAKRRGLFGEFVRKFYTLKAEVLVILQIAKIHKQ